MANRIQFEDRSSRHRDYCGRKDGRTELESQINISRGPTCTDKTNMSSMRKVYIYMFSYYIYVSFAGLDHLKQY